MVTIQIQLLFALTSVKITHFAEVFIFSMTRLSDHLMAKQPVKNSYTINELTGMNYVFISIQRMAARVRYIHRIFQSINV